MLKLSLYTSSKQRCRERFPVKRGGTVGPTCRTSCTWHSGRTALVYTQQQSVVTVTAQGREQVSCPGMASHQGSYAARAQRRGVFTSLAALVAESTGASRVSL